MNTIITIVIIWGYFHISEISLPNLRTLLKKYLLYQFEFLTPDNYILADKYGHCFCFLQIAYNSLKV